TERLLNALEGGNFSPQDPWSIETCRLRIKQYEAATEPLARMVGVLGRWGDGSELSIVLDVLRSICRQAESAQGGINFYLYIRRYPAVLGFTAYGLGLTRSERWRDLHRFLTSELLLNYPDHLNWIVEGLFLWNWAGGDAGLWNDITGD